MIHVDRPLVIVSRDGAGATVLDAAGAPVRVVKIDADGVTFGLKGKGFTVTRSSDDHGLNCPGSNAVLAGNRLVANGGNADSGFRLDNSDVKILQRNVAVANGADGFSVGNGNSALVTDNLAIGNGDDGFELSDHTIAKGNVALANANRGLRVGDDVTLTGNTAQGNRRGIELDGNCIVTKNSVVGNRGFGIVVHDGGNVITKNSIFGNDVGGDCFRPILGHGVRFSRPRPTRSISKATRRSGSLRDRSPLLDDPELPT